MPNHDNFDRITHDNEMVVLRAKRPSGAPGDHLRLTQLGLSSLVNEATAIGYRPTLRAWAEGYLTDSIELQMDDDDHDSEVLAAWNALSPQQRKEYVAEEAKSLARILEDSIEHFSPNPPPDLRED